MPISSNGYADPNCETGRRVLLVAYPEVAEPMKTYLQWRGDEVTAPLLDANTAEACAALLFPPRGEAANPRKHRRWYEVDDDVAIPGPPAFFAWNAFDAVIIQDLWMSKEDNRVIPLGCLIAATDYYIRGNFTKPAVVLVTDPSFFGEASEEALHNAFDRNRQLRFVPLVGTPYNRHSLAEVRAAIRNENGNGNGNGHRLPPRRPAAPSAHETDAPNQSRAVALFSRSLAAYIATRARVVLVDDSEATIRAVAAQFKYDVSERPPAHVHLSEITADVTARATVSYASFEQLRQTCERIVDEAVAANELLIVVTDILFDDVRWEGDRKTGIDLIELLRGAEFGRRVKLGVVGLTGVISPMVTTAAFHRGADAVVNKSTGQDVTLHHAHLVDEMVVFKLLLTVATLCFQHEFLRAKRHVPPASADAEVDDLRRVIPSYAVSPHLQVEWEATEFLLQQQAQFADTATAQAERAIRRIREQYD
jgi:hypothetical protein